MKYYMLTNYESGQNGSVLDDPTHKCYVQKKGVRKKVGIVYLSMCH